MPVSHRTTAEFAPPRWLFALRDNGGSMFGYSRRELGSGEGRAALFNKEGDEGPQVASLGNLTAVFDGVLYEPAELACELSVPQSPGNKAQLLLECYRAFGESFFGKLRGTFTFVLWDAKNQVLFAVRDPLGYYPCFFVQRGANFLVSTSARVLLDHPDVSSEINRLVLLDSFFDIWARREETFYSNVKRVSPGHVLRVKSGNSTLFRYWNPIPFGGDRRFLEEDDLGRFPILLARSVTRCVEHGPVGIFLSGGLDSVSVAALAREASLAAGLDLPKALSLVFPGPEYDESVLQTSVARQLGLRQDLVRLEDAAGPSGLFGRIRDLSSKFSFPIQNIWLPAYSHLTLLAKERGIRTILTGGGGDEWLGVSPYVSADLIRTFGFGELSNLWNSIAGTVPVSKFRLGWNLFWLSGLRALMREQALQILNRVAPRALRSLVRTRRARKKPSWLKVDPELWREFRRRLEECETDFRPLAGPYGYYFGDTLRGIDHPIISWEMEENFENSCRLGSRLLHPYIDADLIEMLCAVPPTLLTIGGASKGLVRGYLADRFPSLGFERQKKIVVRRALPQSVLGDALGEWREGGKAKELPALGLADANRLDAYLTGILKSDSHHDTFRAWQIVATEHWLRARQ